MAMIIYSTELFLEGLEKADGLLLAMGFERHSIEKQGYYAFFVQYKCVNSSIEFVFGPPEYHVSMVIYTSRGKFEFKDLLQIPIIAEWVDKHRPSGKQTAKDEVL